MAPLRPLLWLRSRGDALTKRCAAVIQRRRMRRAQAQLPPKTRAKADFWRTLYLNRNARMQREREARRKTRGSSTNDLPAPTISKADVHAAIARSRANREARLKAARDDRES